MKFLGVSKDGKYIYIEILIKMANLIVGSSAKSRKSRNSRLNLRAD